MAPRSTVLVAVVAAGTVVVPSADATLSRPLPAAAQGHPYRHGVVPPRGLQASSPAPSSNMSFGGGTSGVGVTTGPPKVYLVFWGSQWGSQGTNSGGDVTLSGDSSGMAPYLQEFIKGLGTGAETWSGVMTQYCQGVTSGSQSCPSSNTQHVGYPTGGALAGVWVDESSMAPQQANGNDIGAEAVSAAGHFGNASSTANRDAQYVIVSPTGTNPDGFNTPSGQFCAWHDYTGDGMLSGGMVSSPYGPLAFTNLPYVTDAGASCGENFVNSGSAGLLDGVSIVEGHEYAETITDQFPAGGWTDSSGFENGDKCAWISPPKQGYARNITLTTGTFAVQSTWANDLPGCEVSHSIVTDPNTVTVNNPGNQTNTVGQAASLQIVASDSDSSQALTYSATGLPAGLSINSADGLISGTPSAAISTSVTVTAKDSTNASGSTTFTWTVVKRATSTTVSCAPSTVSVRAPTTCTATVTDTATGSASTPTGTVSFTPTGSCTLAGTGTTGVAACQTAYTPSTTGPQTVTASYQGDSTHSTSNSSAFGITVTTRSTTTTVSCSPAPVNAGSSTTCTATVTDTDAGTASTPTGTVDLAAAPTGEGSFASGGTCTLGGSGSTGIATCQATYTPSTPSPQTITAGYQGDSTHATSTSSGFSLTVTGNTVTVTAPGDQSTPVGTSASLQIGAGDSDGSQTLSYSASGLPSGLSINSGTGLITGTATTIGSKSVTVTAKDSTGATGSTSFTWTITKRSTSTSVACSPASLNAGAPATCTATVADGESGTAATPTGTVSLAAAPPGEGTFTAGNSCTLAATGTTGVASCHTTYTPTTAGPQTITAAYPGDGTHSASNSSGFSLTVKANTVSVTNPGNQVTIAGVAGSLQVAASDSGNLSLTYSATGLPSGLSINSATGLISGVPATTGSSSVTVTATDPTNASGSATFTWTVATRSTSTSLSCAPSTLVAGSPTTCTTIVSDTDAGTASTPTGTVSLSGGGICNLTATGTTGVASCQVGYIPMSEGPQTVTSSYGGDSTHTVSNSGSFALSVTAQSGTSGGSSTTSPVLPGNQGQLAAGLGCPAPTGRITGSKLGLVRLGMTRVQARAAYSRSSLRSSKHVDVFCLMPTGVRVGYATTKLLAGLSAAQRRQLRGRVVWITTANPYFTIGSIHAGATVARVSRAFRHALLLEVRGREWYVIPGRRATVVVAVRGGVVQEVGIVSNMLAHSRRSDLRVAATLS